MSDGPVVFHCFLTIEISFQPKPEWKYWNEGSEIFLSPDSGVSGKISGVKRSEFF